MPLAKRELLLTLNPYEVDVLRDALSQRKSALEAEYDIKSTDSFHRDRDLKVVAIELRAIKGLMWSLG
jgi:hypothetical protein